MANVKILCQVIPHGETDDYSLIVLVDYLTKDEAIALGHILHDPVGKAVAQAIKTRVTAETYSWSSRGKTQ